MTETAVFGGGCFWCTEAVFSELRGVLKAEPGYSGGTVANPSYEQVCTSKTGHAEVVQVTFDPSVISFKDLLEVFFSTHDPTTPNRQGGDVGPQYRSVIFYQGEEQRREAEGLISRLQSEKVYGKPVVTQVAPLTAFYPAEEYHHDYFRKNPSQGYCRAVISPKVAKFRSHYRDLLKAQPGAS
ncbi:MAG TPA: peptide-methionine (S)-S-oxide reductase MsrA [Nitrososphaerales archaeon]|nr:peptide-methionine (S)-S-oxide reductase MsrA [Nitrososphaerales archaeon]HUK75186.1 peptide-methionine (S)-S-oxide reductase MsrA [Nitrososphaerales archaeon]